MASDVERMMNLFRGQDRFHGVYDLSGGSILDNSKGKLVAAGNRIKTVREDVTPALWTKHLKGELGIGIIPIRDDSRCFFGAIDVDMYKNFDVPGFVADLYKKDMPLVPCRSKSGGLHLYLFVKDAIPASLIREKLSVMAAFLGQSTAEIFPKQSEVLSERGDAGSWINVPYFNVLDTQRYAYTAQAQPIIFADFLDLAEKRSLPPEELSAYSIALVGDFSDGPPCLQTIVSKGVSAGTRNQVMFNLAVYAQKSGTDIGKALDKFNIDYMRPALPSEEVQAIVKSMEKKEYHYACNRSPLKDCCNMALCRTKKHGIGGLVGMPSFNSLAKYDTSPPIWFLTDDEGRRMELNTEDLQNQQKFQRRCMEKWNIVPPTIKTQLWQGIMQKLMENLTIIEAPDDASAVGVFAEYLEYFCTSRVCGKTEEDLLRGVPVTKNGRHMFRLTDFTQFLDRQKFYELERTKISMLLKDMGGEPIKKRVKDRVINVWSIPELKVPMAGFTVPIIPGEDTI